MILFKDRIICTNYRGELQIWNEQGCEAQIQLFQPERDHVFCLAAITDDLIAIGMCLNIVRVFSLSTLQCVYVFKGHTHEVRSIVAFKGNIASCSENEICVWNTQGDCESVQPGSMCLAAVGDVLAASSKRTIRLF